MINIFESNLIGFICEKNSLDVEDYIIPSEKKKIPVVSVNQGNVDVEEEQMKIDQPEGLEHSTSSRVNISFFLHY